MRPFDLTKFRKDITKNLDGVSIGFHDPTDWIHTGSYALNYAISGDFFKGVPLGKVSMIAGENSSGKSYLAAGNIASNAQKSGCFVVLLDSENALDENWLRALGVETSDDKLLKLNVAMIDDVAKIIFDFVKGYKAEYLDVSQAERPKVLFVIDSLGMLLTPTDVTQFEAGEMKGDMGRKPKALAALIRNCVNMFGNLNIGLVATNHTYASQSPYAPDPIITGGAGMLYASSIIIATQKFKLKEDEEGGKTTDVNGIRCVAKVVKTRYNKPFEQVEIKIPYDKGMDAYSGLVELFEKKSLFVPDGTKVKYVALDGSEHKYFRKRVPDQLLLRMMHEFNEVIRKHEGVVEVVVENMDEENEE